MATCKLRNPQSIIWSVSVFYFLTRVGESTETPSDICQQIVQSFGSAVSNFTLCSISHARPIHLCTLCVTEFVRVVETHQRFSDTTDMRGYLCQEYFTNLDRIEIVSEANKYVHYLWKKANCDYCFQKFENGTLDPVKNYDTFHFEQLYNDTKGCFDHVPEAKANETCTICKKNYTLLNDNYIRLSTSYGENICLDIVDTMNITREIWSQVYNCTREKRYEIGLHFGFGLVACIPVIFYILAFFLSNKQEARVMQQKRMAEVEVATINSQSGSSRMDAGSAEPEVEIRPTWFPRERTLR